MVPITSPWPFCKWPIDIVGPFPTESGSVDYLVVAIDFFTKWVEAKPLNKIMSKKIRDFFWESIVCRFGISNEICQVTNGDIVHAIKARLGKQRKGWVDQLPKVLWAHRTTPKNSTGEIPFSLVYGSEAVLHAKIVVPTERTLSFNRDKNARDLCSNLDLLKERREMAAAREAVHKQQIARYYDKRVKLITYVVGDLVWRDNQKSRIEDTGKLGPNWEGPYRIIGISKKETYKLAELNGKAIKPTWHATALKRCYM
ncbi:uncharacterized protein [Rutidosis leptorrhynchoides]|uniref:uncharacterized protein n=1 Tax=Rutidosis leptorrhynchoides TaxID=125765 RepID=UPI003A99DE50